MPPKAAEPPPPAAPNVDELWAEEQEREAVIEGALEGLLSGVFTAAAERRTGSRAVSYAAMSAVHEMTKVVDVFLMELEEYEISMQPCVDDEPVPAPKPKRERGPRVPSSAASETASQAGGSRPSSATRTRSPATLRRASMELPAVPEAKGQAIPVAKSRNPPADKSPRAQSLMTPAEESDARKAADEHEHMRRLEDLRTSMKGRVYTMDAAGNVILVDLAKPERLPPYKLYPGIGLRTGGEDAQSPPKKGASAKAARPPGGSTGRGPRVELGASSYEPLQSLQPPLMESLRVREGVTLRESDAVKEGGSRPVDPQRMSRKDFDLFARTAQAQAESLVAEDPAGATADPSLDAPPAEDAGAPAGSAPAYQPPKGWGQNPPLQPVVPPRQARAKPPGMRARGADATVTGVSGAYVPAFRERGGTAVKNRVPPPQPPPSHPPAHRAGA